MDNLVLSKVKAELALHLLTLFPPWNRVWSFWPMRAAVYGTSNTRDEVGGAGGAVHCALFGNYVHFLLSSKAPLIFLEKILCSLQEFPILLFWRYQVSAKDINL